MTKECSHPKWEIVDNKIICRLCGFPHPEWGAKQ